MDDYPDAVSPRRTFAAGAQSGSRSRRRLRLATTLVRSPKYSQAELAGRARPGADRTARDTPLRVAVYSTHRMRSGLLVSVDRLSLDTSTSSWAAGFVGVRHEPLGTASDHFRRGLRDSTS